MKYCCNPINFEYMYQFNKQPDGRITASRESADPSMILFRGRYYIYPSMTCGFLYSDDMAEWKFHPLKELPVYDYAPDVRVVGEYIYFCASNHEQGVHYRTRDPFSDEYEKIDGQFPFWDPNLFADDDGRLYFYWGSSTTEPLYGIELDAVTLKPVGDRKELFYGDDTVKGFERKGENHIPERTQEEKEEILKQMDLQDMPASMAEAARAFVLGLPYIEGAWMNKHNGRYYLQYGTPGSGFNIYGDGVYVSENPLGPFQLAKNNPFSYKPGGFLPGAGHGSSMEDCDGDLWHIATMRICTNHNFERRIGLWPAGWDSDGEMFCNQRYGDWPYAIERVKADPWAEPEWMLLSYGKIVRASSSADGKQAENITDEDVRTCWKAATSSAGEWVEIDLESSYDVRAVQVNFADDNLTPELPEGIQLCGALHQERWIDEKHQPTRWKLEGSADGEEYFIIQDKSDTDTDLPHDLVVLEEGIQVRYLRLTVESLPYGQAACVSGLRVFGLGNGPRPVKVSDVNTVHSGDLDLYINWRGNAVGYVVEWGYTPEKLYHSYQVFTDSVHIGGLVKGQEVYVRIDSFNESGITVGEIVRV